MKDERGKIKTEGRSRRQTAGAGGRELTVEGVGTFALTARRRIFFYCLLLLPSASCSCLLPLFSVVALSVEEAELLFAQRGVGDLDLHLAKRAVGGAVRGRVGDEVLRAQLVPNLREGGGEVFRVFGEEGATARLLRDVAQEVAAHLALAEVPVADAD